MEVAPRASSAAPIAAKRTLADTEPIGEGTHGRVERVTSAYMFRTYGRDSVAVKRLKHMSNGVSITAYREMALVRELSHPNIVRLLGVNTVPSFYLIFEDGGQDLTHHLREAREPLDITMVSTIMRQLFEALSYLHGVGVMHRDVKPANVLLFREANSRGSSAGWMLKLCDFGLARLIEVPLRPLELEGPVVTLSYRAVELLLGAPSHGPPVDLWSVGCILAECLTLRVLFNGIESRGEAFQQDQLLCIFSTLGVPSVENWPVLATLRHWPKALALAQTRAPLSDQLEERLRREAPREAPAGGAHHPGGALPSSDALALLRGLLCFSPDSRLTARAALEMCL